MNPYHVLRDYCTVSDLFIAGAVADFSTFLSATARIRMKRRQVLLHASILKKDKNFVGGLTGIQPVPLEFCDKRRHKVRLFYLFLVTIPAAWLTFLSSSK